MKGADTSPDTAVLLLTFGGPHSLDEIEWFLEQLMGKPPSPEHVKDLQSRYRSIGGSSPLPEITDRQARVLEERLHERGQSLSVYVGMRYEHPLIAETLGEIRKKGISRLILLSLSPYHSPFTSEGYYDEVRNVIATWDEGMKLVQVYDWHDHPFLCAAWADQVKKALRDMGKASPVIFTAHSLPMELVVHAPYVGQLEETVRGIIKLTGPLPWQLAFQSRGRGGDWLGPEPETVLERLLREGHQEVVITPIGFITDHLETLYDLDISLKGWAGARGIRINRVPCLNDSPGLIETLVQLVEGALKSQ